LWWVVTATWLLAIPADPPITSPHVKINRCVTRFNQNFLFDLENGTLPFYWNPMLSDCDGHHVAM
jgi:hypothetical protein